MIDHAKRLREIEEDLADPEMAVCVKRTAFEAADEIVKLKAEAERLRRERNALLIGLLLAKGEPERLDDPLGALSFINTGIDVIRAHSFARYLDLPSDLTET